MFRAFHIFLKLQKPCKYQHFCDQPAKNAVIYSVFFVFALLPQKTLKRKNAVIYSILSISKSWKSSEKCVKTALFSDFRYPQNGGGGMLLETLMSDPDSSQKALPHPPEGFLVFFGARRRRVGSLGREWWSWFCAQKLLCVKTSLCKRVCA